jgi:hypothetical protein
MRLGDEATASLAASSARVAAVAAAVACWCRKKFCATHLLRQPCTNLLLLCCHNPVAVKHTPLKLGCCIVSPPPADGAALASAQGWLR